VRKIMAAFGAAQRRTSHNDRGGSKFAQPVADLTVRSFLRMDAATLFVA